MPPCRLSSAEKNGLSSPAWRESAVIGVSGQLAGATAIIAAFRATGPNRRATHPATRILALNDRSRPPDKESSMKARFLATSLLASLLLVAGGAQGRDGTMTCKMSYTLTGW